MKRLIFGFGLLIGFLSLAVAATGEQRVVLRAGLVMSGDVSVEGENLIVTVDGAKLAIPLKDVASVTPAANTAEMAQRLLLRSLEFQLLYGGADNQIGLLSEAYRIAPDDPQVAYWYARALADAGNAVAAKDVYDARKAAIVAAYPGLADRLVERIEKRLKLKSLPAELVKRIDDIEAAARKGRNDLDDRSPYAAFFRVVDQDDAPIEDVAMRVNSHGDRQKLETFADGYHLLTYFGYGSGEEPPSRLVVEQLGLESATFDFRGGASEVADAGVFRVLRLTEKDQIPAVITVRGADGEPLNNVTIALSTRTELHRQRGVPPLVTDAKGRAEVRLLPGDYFCQVIREGYLPINERIFVNAKTVGPMELNFRLDRAMSAAAKVVWRATTKVENAGGMSEMALSGEYELRVAPQGNVGYRGGRGGIEGIRLIQSGTTMTLQFTEMRNDPRIQDDPAWVGRLKSAEKPGTAKDGDQSERPTKSFITIDLTKLEEIKGELDLPNPNLRESSLRSAPLKMPAELGAIYVGAIHGRDSQTGRPARFDFKLMVTELSSP